MVYYNRLIEKKPNKIIALGKSVLLLGPRQTGKTTLLSRLKVSLHISLVKPENRLRYEKNPSLLTKEVTAIAAMPLPLIIIDEIQKVPVLMDVVQDLIDRKIAQFIIIASSARKLKCKENINLLPGRVIPLYLDPFSYQELGIPNRNLEDFLLDGSLPEIILSEDIGVRELLLDAYVTTYLEEEIRAEAITRDLGAFARFLELAASESGNIINFSKLSHEIGVAHTTISNYYIVLQDCLIAHQVEAMSCSNTRRKLTKAAKYLFFDLGVRRLAANEGRKLSRQEFGRLFEQYVGLELIKHIRYMPDKCFIRHFRDVNGVAIDWIIECNNNYIPIEVRWSDAPSTSDTKYLRLFLDEYPGTKEAYIVCRTPRRMQLSERIFAIPWQEINKIVAI